MRKVQTRETTATISSLAMNIDRDADAGSGIASMATP